VPPVFAPGSLDPIPSVPRRNCVAVAKREIQGNAITSTELWSLSADGKLLTVDSTIAAPQGEFKLKFVLDKQ